MPSKNDESMKSPGQFKLESQLKPKTISLFCGCGGLDLAFHREGYDVVWANDSNPWAVETYNSYFNEIATCADIHEIDPYGTAVVPDADLVIGGFPCQDFSIIWKRPGLAGKGGNLYKEFLRFVDAKRPSAFVAENVKGLLSANNYRAIEQIISDFENVEPGYLVTFKVYNFAEYGVPQLRERVLIVGIRMDTGFNFRHPEPTHGLTRSKPFVTAGEALEGVEEVLYNPENMNILPRTAELLKLIPEGGNFADIPTDNPLYVKGMISHVYRRIHRAKPSHTIIAGGGGGTWGYHFPEPRALTNRERARLQTLPDDMEFKGSFGEIRRQIGNAVPTEGVRPLAKELKRLYHGNYELVDLYARNSDLKKLTIKQRLKAAMVDHE